MTRVVKGTGRAAVAAVVVESVFEGVKGKVARTEHPAAAVAVRTERIQAAAAAAVSYRAWLPSAS